MNVNKSVKRQQRFFLKTSFFIRFLFYSLKSGFDKLPRYFRKLHNCFWTVGLLLPSNLCFFFLQMGTLRTKNKKRKNQSETVFFFFFFLFSTLPLYYLSVSHVSALGCLILNCKMKSWLEICSCYNSTFPLAMQFFNQITSCYDFVAHSFTN